jgi:hypothetical protein
MGISSGIWKIRGKRLIACAGKAKPAVGTYFFLLLLSTLPTFGRMRLSRALMAPWAKSPNLLVPRGSLAWLNGLCTGITINYIMLPNVLKVCLGRF